MTNQDQDPAVETGQDATRHAAAPEDLTCLRACTHVPHTGGCPALWPSHGKPLQVESRWYQGSSVNKTLIMYSRNRTGSFLY